MNEDLIAAIEALTEAVNSLSGKIESLELSFPPLENKLDYLSEKVVTNTKNLEKLTSQVEGLRFK